MINKKTRIKALSIGSAMLAFFALVYFIVPERLDTKIPFEATVAYVVDGDTLVLNTREKIRLIGVDTPEKYESKKLFRMAARKKVSPEQIVAQGIKASEFTRDLVLGKKVLVVLDENNKGINHRDKYDRVLAYIYILNERSSKAYIVGARVNDKSAIFLNASIINAGYGEFFRNYEYKHKDYFRSLEQIAKRERRGLWK